MDDLDILRKRLFGEVAPAARTLATETVRVLTHYQFERSAAAYTLMKQGMVWDAEIIVRVIYETSAKVIFIGAHEQGPRTELIDEYWSVLPAIFDRKGALKAEEAEKTRRRFADDQDDIRIFRHLRNPSLFNTAPMQNKRFRDEAERRWSFSEIVKELVRVSDRHVQVRGLEALNHMYGVASHLAHASPKALDLMDDRALREDDLHALEAGHMCRLFSDIVLMTCFSIRFSQRVIDGSQTLADQLNQIAARMSSATEEVQHEFARSQDSFYDKYEQ